MHRRQVLASGTALLAAPLAGCAHPSVVLDFETATATRIADAVSTAPEPGSAAHEVVTAARENGSATRRGRSALFDRTDAVRVGGAVYEVSETRTASSEVTVYTVTVEAASDDTADGLREVAYEDLPEADRNRLRPIRSDGLPDGDAAVGIDYGTAEEIGSDSAFVPEQRYDVVVAEGERYRVRVDSRTASQGEYRYEVTEIAPDVEAFADRVRDRYLFALSGLSDAEREVVEEAIDGGYFEDDDAFRSVVDRIRDHEGLDVEDSYGTWLPSYEDEAYLAYVEW